MSATLQAFCPACGAPVAFKSGSSVVVVCEYCHSVVARTDRALEDLGKVAEVSESGSPLDIGLKGSLRGVAFELTGRAQLGHAAGGMWDEWYAMFADGRWGWLAEAQGRYLLTFQRELPDASVVPPFEALEAGAPLPSIPTPEPLVVAEKGEARMLAAEGEIPYRLVPGETYAFADLSGRDAVFGTIDYGDTPPLLFVGREVTLDELGIAATTPRREREPRRVAATQLHCPQCGGPLELRAPDAAERVTCPNCGSLLDVNKGQLRYLKTLEPKGPKPSIPIGGTCEFEGVRFTVIGFMVRSVEFEGVRYFWQEYLLYEPRAGFRWLVESDAHWSYVKSIPVGEVTEGDKYATYEGRSFKIFQDAQARVEYVQGEFYWKVTAGELVRAVDYVAPPQMLSKEVSGAYAGKKNRRDGNASEVNWSLGTYVPVKEIERQFNVQLPAPSTVAPNQPFRHKGVYRYWLLFSFIALLIGVAHLVTGSGTRVFEQSYTLQASPTPSPSPSAATTETGRTIQLPGGRTITVPGLPAATPTTPSGEGQQVIFTDAFELRGGKNLRVTASANVDNNWLFVAGDLINEETGLVQQFEVPVEYYYGVDGGESWTEGDRQKSVYISALPAGRYTLRLEAQWEDWKQPAPPQVSVRIEQGVPRIMNLFLTLVGLAVIPLIVAVSQFSFERRRWADSAFNPYDSGGEDGGDE